jgi:hypothetical protein
MPRQRLQREDAPTVPGRPTRRPAPVPAPPSVVAPPRGVGWRWLVGFATLAVLIAGGTVVAAEALQRGNGRPFGAAPTAGAPGQPAPEMERSPAAPPVALGLLPHRREVTAAAATPVPSRPPQRDEYALVQGWTWHHDPSGFRVAVPAGWLRTDDAGTVVFTEPGGSRVLGVARLVPPPADPAAEALAGERRRVAEAALVSYARINIQSCNYYPPCVQWEYTYQGPGGTRLHAVDRSFRPVAGIGYEMLWQTSDFDWPTNTIFLSLINASFRG